MIRLCWIFYLLTFHHISFALDIKEKKNSEEPDSTVCKAIKDRPCIALVLGGGGARGSAHIGVIRALEELGTPIDLVVGTSIGSLVGGLFASGKSSKELEDLFRNTDWNSGYRDALSRSAIPIRNKRQLDAMPIHLDLGIGKTGIRLPKGLVLGQGMKVLVDRMLGNYSNFENFDLLPIPFRAVAADAETGEQVILDHGDLATAMQISMSLPGIVRPIKVNGRLLVDGGIANNLPISVAKQMGADIIIAVDIGSPALEQSQLSSGIAILRQLTSFLTRINVDHQKLLLDNDDILLKPNIDGVGLLSFDKTLEAIDAGYKAAHTKLQSYSTPTQSSKETTTVSSSQKLHQERIYLHKIILDNQTQLSDEYILHRMKIQAGQEYSAEDLHQAINRLYGQGTIARIRTYWNQENGENTLTIQAEEKEWGPGYLNFKFAYEDTFTDIGQYQIGMSYRLSNLSVHGAEWYNEIDIGTEKRLHTEYYMPIYSSGLFTIAELDYERDIEDYKSDGKSLGTILGVKTNLTTGLGWASVDRMQISTNIVSSQGKIKLPEILKEQIQIDTLNFKRNGGMIKFNYDTLDHAKFPRSGLKISAQLSRFKDDVLNSIEYTTVIDSEINQVLSVGRHALRSRLKYQSTKQDNTLALLETFSLGGFLNLSGNPSSYAQGRHVRFTSLNYTYEMIGNNFGVINLPLYLGLSLEAGNAWSTKQLIDYSELIHSASAYIGWDSPFGAMYLGYGKSDTGNSSLYFYLGAVL